MPARAQSPWLSRLLFGLALVASAGLILLVIVAPLLDHDGPAPGGWPGVVAVFARDGTLRRTAVASGLGLFATACIFFRPRAAAAPPGRRRPRQTRQPPPPDVAGA